MKEAKVHFGGVPTEPDVKRLLSSIAVERGEEVSHETVEAILGIDREQSRYRTVTTAWRRRVLREFNTDTVAVAGVGFRFLLEGERVSESIKDFGKGTRKIGRSLGRISRVETEQLSDGERTVVDHGRRLMAATLDAARRAQKEIGVPKAAKVLPRVAS